MVLPPFEYYSETEKQIMSSTSSTFSAGSWRGLIVNIVLFILIYFASGFLWSLTNFVQLINFLPGLNVAAPANVTKLFALLEIANLNI